jgi:hypothetical protein
MRLFVWLDARSELKSGYGVRNHRCRVVDDENELGSIKRMECRALVNGSHARGSDRFCRLVIS